MLERRRQTKNYLAVPGDEPDLDIELGETGGIHDQESGVIQPHAATITEELDNWDENAEEWDEDDDGAIGVDQKTPASSTDEGDTKKAGD